MSAPRPSLTCVAADELPPIPGSGAGAFGPRAQVVLSACACAGASLFVFAFDPGRDAVYPQCLLYNLTGVTCAGCGATRALHALLHGRVLAALHDNALFVAALPFVLYLVAGYALRTWRDNAWPAIYLHPGRLARRGGLVVAAMIVFMIVRNLPGFEFLQPLP